MSEQAHDTFSTDRASLERDCDIEFFTGPGPGGQHRNKSRTGVRLKHRPSSIVVTATERRSQKQNLDQAFERLARKLEELNKTPKPRKPTKVPASKKRARVEEKRKRSATKKLRKPPGRDE